MNNSTCKMVQEVFLKHHPIILDYNWLSNLLYVTSNDSEGRDFFLIFCRLVLIKRAYRVIFVFTCLWVLINTTNILFQDFSWIWLTFTLLLIFTIPSVLPVLEHLFKKIIYFQCQGQSVPNGNCVSPSHTPPQSNAAQPPKPAWRPLGSQGPAAWEGASNLVRLRLLILNTFKFGRKKWVEFNFMCIFP